MNIDEEMSLATGQENPPETAPLRDAMAKQARELARTALELEQAALFSEEPFEEALLLPPDEIKKKYTGANGEKMVWRQEAALYMLGRQCPAADIARVLHMNLRVIAALAAQHGRKLAGFTEAFAQELASSAAADFALAETKRDQASYKDLNIGAGIKMTHAMGLKLAGVGSTMDDVIELEAENEKLTQAREFLKQLKPAHLAVRPMGGEE